MKIIIGICKICLIHLFFYLAGCSSAGGSGSAARVTETILAYFSIGHENITGLNSPRFMKFDSSGNLFVVDDGNNRVIKYDSTGAFLSIFAGKTGQANGEVSSIADVAFDSVGNVYILCSQPGYIHKYTAAGIYLSSFSTPGAYPAAIAFDSADNLFLVEGNGLDRVQKYNTGYVLQWTIGGVSASSADGEFNRPGGIAVDGAGNFYVADTYNHRIQKFDNNGNFLSKVGSSGSGLLQFSYPRQIYFRGDLYVADSYNSRIQKIGTGFAHICNFGSSGTGNGQFTGLAGVAVHPSGKVFVSDYVQHRIQIANTSSCISYESQFGMTGSVNYRLSSPQAIAKNSVGEIFVYDTLGTTIKKYSSSGIYIMQIGSSGGSNGNFHGTGAKSPGMVFDNSDNFFVVDTYNQRVQKFNSSGAHVLNITLGFSGAAISYPTGLGINRTTQVLYVVDRNNSRIQKYDVNGNSLLQFGSGGSGDGQFGTMDGGIAVDAVGNVYVVDTGNNRIQQFDANGNFLSKFGSAGTANGLFSAPTGIAIDSSGNIYIADMGNNRIQKFNSSGLYQSQFGTYGIERGQFSGLVGLYIDGGYIYTAEKFNNRIQKFDLSGNLAQ